ncbi:hypothetical protein FRC20_001076 [Serendipita sp. 405]|nr:hypothetical protein FRC16_002128 [Serendipita sp. 398]KAG8785003.1 hypothetical protein FRC15_002165 [Serendipita sp. 397]KAG8869689.1 hypothetical protein FRC20_001076 [Serendipita sp. 405]
MPSPVAYSDFLNQNGALVNDGGPWAFTRSSTDVNCGTSEREWCKDVPHCLECWVFPSASLSSYSVTFNVNLSVPMNQYGNADSLDYDFSYQVDWASTITPRGTSLTSTSTVGSNSFSSDFAADNHDELLYTRQTWVGDPFSHSGNTPVVKYGGQMGYIDLSVGLTFPRKTSDYINYYMKGYKFRITTPTSVVEAPAASNTNSPSPSSSSSVSTTSSAPTSLSSGTNTSLASLPNTLAPDVGTSQSSDSGGGASVASSSSNNNPAPSKKVSTAAIAGGVLGAVALLSALIFFFLFHRRRKQRREEEMKRAVYLGADRQNFWVSPNSMPDAMVKPIPTTNINDPPNQHGINPFMIPSQPPNSGGYAFDYGNGGGATMAARGDGSSSPQNSISRWVQHQNSVQSQYYNISDAYAEINNHRRAPSLARTTLTGAGTEAPPPAYIAPSALGIYVPPLPTPRNFGYGTPQPLPLASASESGFFLASASQFGATSTSGRGTFVAADAGLSQWARENRSYITEKLEMKLDAAGYVPSDDPDNMSEEEWKREWGVTKLELTRMRSLYARTQAQIQTHETGSQEPLIF